MGGCPTPCKKGGIVQEGKISGEYVRENMSRGNVPMPPGQCSTLLVAAGAYRVGRSVRTDLLYMMSDAVWLSVLAGVVCLLVVVTLSLRLSRRRSRCTNSVVDKSSVSARTARHAGLIAVNQLRSANLHVSVTKLSCHGITYQTYASNPDFWSVPMSRDQRSKHLCVRDLVTWGQLPRSSQPGHPSMCRHNKY